MLKASNPCPRVRLRSVPNPMGQPGVTVRPSDGLYETLGPDMTLWPQASGVLDVSPCRDRP